MYKTLHVEPKEFEPIIDEKNNLNHLKLYQNYCLELNKLFEEYPKYQGSLEPLFISKSLDNDFKDRFLAQGGGYYNHTLFFENLSKKSSAISPLLQNAINNAFGSLDGFKEAIRKAGSSILGSGWVFLAVDIYKNLKIITYNDHLNPLIDGMIPILAIDCWEHSYYCQYESRGSYLKALLNIIDWDTVSNRFLNLNLTILYES